LNIFYEETESLIDSLVSIETEELDTEDLINTLKGILVLDKETEKKIKRLSQSQAKKFLKELFAQEYDKKEKELTPQLTRILEKAVYLRTIDMLWVDHIDALTHLREGIGLRGYGQKDPLVEYKNEAYIMFQKLLGGIKQEIVNTFFKVTLTKQEPQKKKSAIENAAEQNTKRAGSKANMGHKEKIGRNDPCPCGSGKKYKKCCGK